MGVCADEETGGVMYEEDPISHEQDILVDEEQEEPENEEPVTESKVKLDEDGLPYVTQYGYATLMDMLTPECKEEVEANLQDPSEVSLKCRQMVQLTMDQMLVQEGIDQEEVHKNYAKKMEKLEKEEKASESKQEKPASSKPKRDRRRSSRRGSNDKYSTRTYKKEKEQHTILVIVSVLLTVVAFAIAACWYLNRILNDAGMNKWMEKDEKKRRKKKHN